MAAFSGDDPASSALSLPDSVRIETGDGVWTLKLNRAPKKNALTDEMYLALSQALLAASADEAARAVIISGEGPDFCAGNDLGDFLRMVQQGAEATLESRPVMMFLKTLCYFDKPLIAAVEGQAVGIGSTLLAHCDLVAAGRSTRFSIPFLKLGLTPEAGSSRLMPAMMGHRKAFEWLAFGGSLTADEALKDGLINVVTEDGGALAAALNYATRLSGLSSSALKHAKGLMREPESLWSHVRHEAQVFDQQLRTPEAAAAFQAFFAR